MTQSTCIRTILLYELYNVLHRLWHRPLASPSSFRYVVLFYSVMFLEEAMSLLPNTASAIHSIPIISKAIATIKFKSTMPTNGDAKTINDIAAANTPTPINNDLEPFDTCFDDIPSIILAIPANNRLMPSIITRNPAANNGKARTTALNPITKAPRIMFPALEDFDWFAENPVAILSIPISSSAAARTMDTVATPTLGILLLKVTIQQQSLQDQFAKT